MSDANVIEETKVLIWSNEHKAWWRAGSQGYDPNLAGAGLYERAEAEAIAAGCSGRNEQVVTLERAFVALQKQAWESDKAMASAWTYLDKIERIFRNSNVLSRT